ncbi:MAG: hypothetical protein LBE23_07240 [Vagococcus sp.]|jgi:hypothetical protein|nr:hypothetical protein [Vagococcus sp.]
MEETRVRSIRATDSDFNEFKQFCDIEQSQQSAIFHKMVEAYKQSLESEKNASDKQMEQLKKLEVMNRKHSEMTEAILLSLNGYLMLTGQEDYISFKTFVSPIVQGALNEIEANKKEAFVKMHSKQISDGGF